MKATATVTRLATASSVERIERFINEYACSTNYRVNPSTLEITNVVKPPPRGWFVSKVQGGYLFGLAD